MKRACLILAPAAMVGLVLLSGGCNDESKPTFTRVLVTPACGVAPMQVEGYAILTGGNESGDPTGGNNNLEVAWNFGDGHTASTSLAYNNYAEPGRYTVTVTGSDPDGNSTSAQYTVRVLPDSLAIAATCNFAGGAATTADTVVFDVTAESCDIDPDVPGDYVKMIYRWEMNDAGQHVYETKSPAFRYTAPGDYEAYLTVTYPAWAVTRRDTVRLTITDPPAPPGR